MLGGRGASIVCHSSGVAYSGGGGSGGSFFGGGGGKVGEIWMGL